MRPAGSGVDRRRVHPKARRGAPDGYRETTIVSLRDPVGSAPPGGATPSPTKRRNVPSRAPRLSWSEQDAFDSVIRRPEFVERGVLTGHSSTLGQLVFPISIGNLKEFNSAVISAVRCV